MKIEPSYTFQHPELQHQQLHTHSIILSTATRDPALYAIARRGEMTQLRWSPPTELTTNLL